MAGVEAVTRVRSASAASELSDDVFFGSTSSIHSDINNIFDQGRTDDTPPVAPPRRKKSTAKPPAKEIFREIEVFTAKAIEKDIDNNDLSTKSINNNNNSLDKNIVKRSTMFESQNSKVITDFPPKITQDTSKNIKDLPINTLKEMPPKIIKEKPQINRDLPPKLVIETTTQNIKEVPPAIVKEKPQIQKEVLSKTTQEPVPKTEVKMTQTVPNSQNIKELPPAIVKEKPQFPKEMSSKTMQESAPKTEANFIQTVPGSPAKVIRDKPQKPRDLSPPHFTIQSLKDRCSLIANEKPQIKNDSPSSKTVPDISPQQTYSKKKSIDSTPATPTKPKIDTALNNVQSIHDRCPNILNENLSPSKIVKDTVVKQSISPQSEKEFTQVTSPQAKIETIQDLKQVPQTTSKTLEKTKDTSEKMGDEVVLYSKKPCNNLTMGKDKEAVREDKTISSRPEVRARSSPHLPNDNDAAREQCNPAFAHHFSLQIVDRKTYYPAIKPGQGERISVPSLSQEVKALYLDEAAKVGENKKAASLPTAITQKRGDVTLTAAVESSVHELSADEKHAVALLDEATRDEEFSLLESTRLQIAAEESMRSRKGSFSSDIVEWKRELLQQWDRLEDEEELHCYKPGPEPEEWFSSNDREGRLYFFEQNSNESSWTLPGESIASSPNTSPTTKTPSDTTSCGSPKDKQPPASPTKPGAAVIASLRQGVVAQKTAEAERRLAAAAVATTEDKAPSGDEDGDESPEDGTASPHIRAKLPPGALLLPAYPGLRVAKTRSMVIVDNKRGSVTAGHDESKSASMPRNWPQLLEAGMAVLKEGQLNKTRLTENGKKLRKNWAPSHVVLTELFLLFFRDAKSFAAMKSGTTGGSKPEMSIDLNGAVVETGEKFSSRKNVFVVTTALGQQVLCQEDNMGDAHSWFHQVSLAIKSLPSNGNNSVQRIKCLPSREGSPQVQLPSESPPEEKNAINRTKSVKVKKDTGSVEDLTASNNNAAEQTKIKARLKKFFVRRPTMESLVKKGIWKDEPAFGSYLAKLCFDEPGLPQVPIFVQRCIATIECKPENMKTDGLYRASGNLSQVQKIRLQVDQNNLNVLDQEEDVHVLTGALKLFFRELKEPLIPYDAFNKSLKASTNPNKKEKLQQFRDIIKNLPAPNHDTLKFLLQHLLRVTQEQASNRMHIPNLAIVFGPTLMWPEEESLNMALDLMQQNIVIESLLQEFDAIFR